MRASTSASHACGSTSFIFAVTMRLYRLAARTPPASEPANSHDFLLCRGLHNRNYAHHVIMHSSPREAPARLARWRFPARPTAHNSKALEELHQLVRRAIPAGARSDRLQPVEGALLH